MSIERKNGEVKVWNSFLCKQFLSSKSRHFAYSICDISLLLLFALLYCVIFESSYKILNCLLLLKRYIPCLLLPRKLVLKKDKVSVNRKHQVFFQENQISVSQSMHESKMLKDTWKGMYLHFHSMYIFPQYKQFSGRETFLLVLLQVFCKYTTSE